MTSTEKFDKHLTIQQFTKFMERTPKEEFARLVYEYIIESGHQGWDGHPTKDVLAYAKLFKDMMICHEMSVNTNPAYFKRPITTDGINSY